jgi:hypothetical protein
MNTENFKKGMESIQHGFNLINSGPLNHYLDCLISAYNTLLTKYAPFKVGDRVALSHTPQIDKDSGWNHCRQFLIKGATGTVRESECDSKGVLHFSVEFDNESYIDEQTKQEHVTKEKHLFAFLETDLQLTTGGRGVGLWEMHY